MGGGIVDFRRRQSCADVCRVGETASGAEADCCLRPVAAVGDRGSGQRMTFMISWGLRLLPPTVTSRCTPDSQNKYLPHNRHGASCRAEPAAPFWRFLNRPPVERVGRGWGWIDADR